MSFDKIKEKNLINLFVLVILTVLFVLANLNILTVANSEGLMALSKKWATYQFISWVIPFVILLIYFLCTFKPLKFFTKPIMQKIFGVFFGIGGLGLLFLLLLGAGSYQRFFNDLSIKSFVAWLSFMLIYYAINSFFFPKQKSLVFIYVMLSFGVLFVLCNQFSGLSSSPFSLAWSEGSFIYLASTFYSQRIYGNQAPIPYIMSTRHILEGIPFIFGSVSILVQRFWFVFLKLFTSLLFAYGIVRRYFPSKPWRRIFLLFSFIYVFQGVIYYNILLSAVIIIFGFYPDKKIRSLLIVILASFIGGMNRINWVFTPPMLAVIILLLEKRPNFTGIKQFIDWMIYPVILFVSGVAAGFLGLFGYYIGYGGYTFENFVARMQADSLWYRLLPNITFKEGVIFGSLLVTIFLWINTFFNWRKNDKSVRFPYIFVLLISIVLFLGGLLVSAKIGGGADLHNMDAYLVSVLLVFAASCGETIDDILEPFLKNKSWITPITVLVLFTMPVFWQLRSLNPVISRDKSEEQGYVNTLQGIFDHYQEIDSRPILFITQRQLITFNAITDVEMVHDYELVDLFEMVMAENDQYLDGFRTDIKNHRFSLIVTDPQPPEYVYERMFNEESNKWYLEISQYLFEEYQLIYEIDLPASSIQVYLVKDLENSLQQ